MKKYFFTWVVFLTSCVLASEDSSDSIEHNLPIIFKNKKRNHYLKQFERAKQFEDARHVEDTRQFEETRKVEDLQKPQTSNRFENLASSLETLLRKNIDDQNYVIQMQNDELNSLIERKFLERDQKMEKNKNEFVETLNVLLKKIGDLENKVEQDKQKRIDSARILDDYSGQIILLREYFQRLRQEVSGKLLYTEKNMYSLTASFLQLINQVDSITQKQDRYICFDSKDLCSSEKDIAKTPVLRTLTDPELKESKYTSGDSEMLFVQLEGYLKRNSANNLNDDD